MDIKTRLLRSSLLIFSLFLVWSCSVRDLTDMRINGLTLLAVDENNTPVVGAIVQTSDNQNVTTGSDGRAGLRFGAYGVFEVTVTAPDRSPARLTVTMPSDRNETVTAHLGKPGTGGDMSININIGGLQRACHK